MTLTDGRLFRICELVRRTPRRTRRGYEPSVVERLEGRAVPAIVGLSGNASPMIIQPINPMNQPRGVVVNPFRSVTLAGFVAEDGAATPVVTFRVVDQLGRHMPGGTIAVQPAQPGLFLYDNRIGLNMTRHHNQPGGRHYTVFITARDPQGSLTIPIAVRTPPLPHGR
jgi:hypothetical protein